MKYDRIYYTRIFFNQILPQIEKISNQPRYGYHGLTHTTQVALFGIDIAQSIEQDPLPVLLAAGLHDCARTNDDWDTEHGLNAMPIACDFIAQNYSHLPLQTTQQILYAIRHHTIGEVAPDNISACLWDADRIRLSWECGYDKKFFNTARGCEIASLPPAAQNKYIVAQNSYLVWHKIRTQAQLDFDHQQDLHACAVGTEFKTR